MDQVLSEIKSGSPAAHLKHVEVEHDGSKPAVEGATVGHWDKDALLKGIEQGVPLKHVETVDKAAPVIEPDVHIGTNSHAQLMSEVQHAAVLREIKAGGEHLAEHLHHVAGGGGGAPGSNGN